MVCLMTSTGVKRLCIINYYCLNKEEIQIKQRSDNESNFKQGKDIFEEGLVFFGLREGGKQVEVHH